MEPTPLAGGVPYRLAGCRLTVDLEALATNWRALAGKCRPAETAAVVKADGYGLGLEPVARKLLAAGCATFFVATPSEGVALRGLAPDARIFVLVPMLGDGAETDIAAHGLVPCLNSTSEIAVWESFCGSHGSPLPCAIHVDTGMNRLGLTPAEARAFAEENALTQAIEPVLLMSHLACADEPAHPLNRRQCEAFGLAAAEFKGIETSLANSAGIFLGQDYRFGLVRPGIALYGGQPVTGHPNPMRPVATAEARIVQIRYARAGETVSYGATVTLRRDTIIAACAAGYADGYHRAASGAGVPLRSGDGAGASGFVAGRTVPVLGRVTMDVTLFDVTDCGEGAVGRGDWIELFGPNIPLDEAARAAGTISYELLTSLGARYHRRYVEAA
ncbi:MAG: alanine racemase [Rhizobiaceae bacterium]|nr:alanine racemase [Rhizobiaceae bacterium]MCV0408098.1 alanine racemase [Rhizobiaceae bacterium]